MLEENDGLRPRSLFQIILKVLGIFFLRDLVYVVPRFISLLLNWIGGNLPENSLFGNGGFIITQTILALVLPWLLIFKTDLLIDGLRLDAGFLEHTIPVNVHRSTVVSLAVLITGGLVVVNTVPELVKSVLLYFTYNDSVYEKTTWVTMVSPALQVIFGLLIIGYNQQLVLWLEQRRRMRL